MKSANTSALPVFLHRCTLVAVTAMVLSGCAVVTVAGAAVGVAATVASTAVDVTVGTAKLGVKAGSKVIGAVVGDEE